MVPQPLDDDQARILEVGRLKLGDAMPMGFSTDITLSALCRHIVRVEGRLIDIQHRLNDIETELESVRKA